MSAANYNHNHYNLPFSDMMIIVIISDGDMLLYYNDFMNIFHFVYLLERKVLYRFVMQMTFSLKYKVNKVNVLTKRNYF